MDLSWFLIRHLGIIFTYSRLPAVSVEASIFKDMDLRYCMYFKIFIGNEGEKVVLGCITFPIFRNLLAAS